MNYDQKKAISQQHQLIINALSTFIYRDIPDKWNNYKVMKYFGYDLPSNHTHS